MTSLLDKIHDPESLKSIPQNLLVDLCKEIRAFLIDTILNNGGHFAGNLGVVELSVALHYIFNSPDDKLIWDVGHQSYVHKMLTGRRQFINSIRDYNGISGFPKREESNHDIFGTGHSSTAISAASGIAFGEKLNGLNNKIIAIVGDGALTGGMSFEALNNLMLSGGNVLVIINDNHIGIDPNNGAVDDHLQNISPNNNLFTNLNLPYFGPIDGHDIFTLLNSLSDLKNNYGPAVLHIRTIKGKGFEPAEIEQTRWHSASKYVKIESHEPVKNKKWQEIFADEMNTLASEFSDITGITPAMPSGSGMIANMLQFPKRFVDVGIAEQHAVTFAAGIATTGLTPYVNIYSSFLQRGYDQLIHDVALQKLHVVFCVDRAGLVGEDGPTHHGAFDLAFLLPIPNLTVCAPRNEMEFRYLLRYAYHLNSPIAIRYPKGELPNLKNTLYAQTEGEVVCLNKGKSIAIISTGIASNFALEAVEMLQADISVFHLPFIKPLNLQSLSNIIQEYHTIITIEDGCIKGGFGDSLVTNMLPELTNKRVYRLGIPDEFIGHGANEILYENCGYGPKSIASLLTTILHSNKE